MAAAAVQWTVDQFYGQLRVLSNQIASASSALAADKAKLTALYSAAKKANNAKAMAALSPLIHNNSVLRLSYLAPVKAKFNEATAAATAALKRAGVTPPGLSGLALAPAILVPAVAVAAVVAALAAVAIVNRLTQAQIARTNALAGIMADTHTTPEQKLALAAQLEAQAKAERQANPPLFDPNAFVMPLALVAAVVLGPQLIAAFRRRTGVPA